jgi:hypothetical protein
MDDLTEQKKPVEAKRGRGRPEVANKLIHRKLGLHEDEWEYLRKWQSENGTEGDNFGPALIRFIEDARRFFPGGPMVEKPRGEKGWWLPGNGTSRNALTRERRRKAREEAQKEEAEA